MLVILQIIIAVVVIYFLFSLVVSYISEWISSFIQLRGKILKEAVIDLLRDREIGEFIYNHPQLKGLRSSDKKYNSYIPSTSYSAALIQYIASKQPDGSSPYEKFLASVKELPDGNVKELLQSFTQNSKDMQSLSASIEKWYDDCMDRVTGWYKKRMKIILFFISLTVAIFFNVDTIYIIRAAKADPEMRQRLNDLGDRLVTDSTINQRVAHFRVDADYYDDYENDTSVEATDSVIMQTEDQPGPVNSPTVSEQLARWREINLLIKDSDLPIGWPVNEKNPWAFIILGWLITAVALTAGAPFWFDVLKNLINIRATGPKPEARNK